jgi:DNA-binding transcriptional LysR family regulator
MAIDDWNELRTAFQVARLGTVSGAAAALGVHHATVIRHVDSLEGKLGTKLFQRHARGYTPTEAGQDLLVVAQRTDDQLAQLAGRVRGRGEEVTGDLIITSLGVLAPLLSPALAAFRDKHPDLTIKFLTDERVFRLEYGEAHLAIRAGAQPQEPDNIVRRFYDHEFALYAARDYLARHGPLADLSDPGDHVFIGSADEVPRAPFLAWMRANVPARNVAYQINEITAMQAAVEAGLGIGFLPTWKGEADETLEMVAPPRPEWAAPLWLVSHVDLARTAKVRMVTSFLRDWAKGWPAPMIGAGDGPAQ